MFSGGNITPGILSRALDRGMAEEGRLYQFKVTVADRPGAMAELCSILASIGIAMRDCIPARAWIKGNVNNVEVRLQEITYLLLRSENCSMLSMLV